MAKTSTIGDYLVQRLEQLGLKHIFGVPGDYVLSFYDLLEESRIQVVGTCTEIGAGYAADAYARVNGLGAVCVTYCVGGLNVLNGSFTRASTTTYTSGLTIGGRTSSRQVGVARCEVKVISRMPWNRRRTRRKALRSSMCISIRWTALKR